jgi:hypothetical protein
MGVKYRFYAIVLLAAISLAAFSQGTVVTGIVKDNRGVPIVGARICQVNSTNCTAADMNGIFHLLMEADKEMSLNVTCPGFNPADAEISDTTTLPITVTLTPMYFPEETFSNDFGEYTNPDIITRSSLALDILWSDFSEFTPLLGSYNTDAMDYFAVTGPELGASFPRFYAGFGLGMGYSYKDNADTLTVDLNNTQFKLNLGYDIISSHRIRMTPLISFRWLKYRLRNYSAERKVPLQTYLQEKETDLRFNQTAAVFGLNLEYIMYSGNRGMSDYWSVGIFGGYAVKLNRKPWIRSDGNRITADNAIRLKPPTAGITISYYSSPK